MATVAVAALVASLATAKAAPSFYDTVPQDLAGEPGTVIRQEPLDGAAPPGAAAFRILYRSTGLRGEPIAVSGVLVVPDGPAPEGGRPIVAWQHPTSGVDRPCAPSLSPSVLRTIQGLPDMLRRGYVVVATDYPGLGTEGPHPYLSGQSEGRAVLDAVRAVRSLPEAHAGERFAVWGHSQGGHATLWAALLAQSYAPGLRAVGVAAAAPATELETLLGAPTDTPDSELLTAMVMWSWSRVFKAPLGELVAPADVPAVTTLAQVCFDPPFDGEVQPEAAPMPAVSYRMLRRLPDPEPWRSLAARNTPDVLPADIPVFLAQGGADALIPTAVTADYGQRLCAAGSAVRLLVMPGVEHRFIARDSAGAAIGWIADRFAGRPAPNDCEAAGRGGG